MRWRGDVGRRGGGGGALERGQGGFRLGEGVGGGEAAPARTLPRVRREGGSGWAGVVFFNNFAAPKEKF